MLIIILVLLGIKMLEEVEMPQAILSIYKTWYEENINKTEINSIMT